MAASCDPRKFPRGAANNDASVLFCLPHAYAHTRSIARTLILSLPNSFWKRFFPLKFDMTPFYPFLFSGIGNCLPAAAASVFKVVASGLLLRGEHF